MNHILTPSIPAHDFLNDSSALHDLLQLATRGTGEGAANGGLGLHVLPVFSWAGVTSGCLSSYASQSVRGGDDFGG